MTSLLGNSRRHDIAFNANGRIDISARIAKILSLRPGDVIDILVDGSEWLLGVKLRNGQYQGRYQGTLSLCTSRSRGGTLRTWSNTLCRRALRAAGSNALQLRCPCGETVRRDGKTYVTIIYRLAL